MNLVPVQVSYKIYLGANQYETTDVSEIDELREHPEQFVVFVDDERKKVLTTDKGVTEEINLTPRQRVLLTTILLRGGSFWRIEALYQQVWQLEFEQRTHPKDLIRIHLEDIHKATKYVLQPYIEKEGNRYFISPDLKSCVIVIDDEEAPDSEDS